jgi:hypothetical protein
MVLTPGCEIPALRQTLRPTMEWLDVEGVEKWGRVGNKVHERRRLVAREATGTGSHRV